MRFREKIKKKLGKKDRYNDYDACCAILRTHLTAQPILLHRYMKELYDYLAGTTRYDHQCVLEIS